MLIAPLAALALLVGAAPAETIYRSSGLELVKTLEGGRVTLSARAPGSAEALCVVDYPAEIGAKDEAGSLGYFPREAAKICFRAFPKVRERLFGGAYNALFRDVERPVRLALLTDEQWRALPGRRTVGAYCSVAFGERRLINCRARRWTRKTMQTDFKAAVIHEMVHLMMPDKGASWIQEGLADHVAYRFGFVTASDFPTCAGGGHYRRGYRCAARLLDFAERYAKLNPLTFAADVAADRSADEAIARNVRGMSGPEPVTAEALWHRCLLVPEAKAGCAGGAAHPQAADAEGCRLCLLNEKASRPR